ncbi:MAG: rhodanese-like domain-containing protein [Gemmataceae bacterium]
MFTLLLSATLLAPATEPPRYAKPELLVEPADTKVDRFTILDTRTRDKYAVGHIPGAVHVAVSPWAKAVNDGKADVAFWSKELAKLGVTPKKPVLVYSDDLRDAARGWWLLKQAGVPDARLLNGGWDAYTAAKLEVSKTAGHPKPAEPFDWKPEPRLAVMAEVVKFAAVREVCVVDARDATEVADGKVPGAKVLEWTELIDDKTMRFKPAGDLVKLFDESKIDLGKPCVTYCQGGGRAAVMAFGLELMGAKDVRNYHKSWGEYGADKTTPDEKK